MHLRDTLDESFQRRQWRVQRALAVVDLLVAAAAGLLGEGPLARARADASAGSVLMSVDWHRSNRLEHSTRLTVEAAGTGVTRG